ncbi:MAG: alpha/beta fold hydrolase [Acidimicrobiia bacterium]|nr:alpha/beta fold hydrolase [Acidimicrobiia bacterium]
MTQLLGYPPARMVALHGFTQHGGMFLELAAELGVGVLAVDLPGHGEAADIEASWPSVVEHVVAAIESVGGPLPLVGYSQGGRVALVTALERPDLVSHLVIISASPGYEDPIEAVARVAADEELATSIERTGVTIFLDRWLASPLFAGLTARGDEWLEGDRRARQRNSAAGLAAALRGMGQGTQPYLGDRLSSLSMPVLILAGAEDALYVRHAQAMGDAIPVSFLEVLEGAGHALVGERPTEVARRIARFLGWSTDG